MGGPREPEIAEVGRDWETRNSGDPERAEGGVGVGGRRRKQPKEAARG